jgi:hypothetical protein
MKAKLLGQNRTILAIFLFALKLMHKMSRKNHRQRGLASLIIFSEKIILQGY